MKHSFEIHKWLGRTEQWIEMDVQVVVASGAVHENE